MNISILARKGRKPHRYTTTPKPVKILNNTIRPAALVAMLVVAIASPVPAQQGETDAKEKAPYINKVKFVGNHNISDDKLRSRIKTKAPAFYNIFRKPRLDMSALRRDIAQLEGFYHSAGFFEASVSLGSLDYSEDRQFVDVEIEIREGKPTLVESVEFSENSLIDEKDLRKGLILKPGDPYNASYLDSDLYTLQSEYFDRGYLAVGISESVDIKDYRARIYFEIDPGTQIKIRDIEIAGNLRSRNSVIEKEIAFKSGDICRLSKLVETQRNLYETGLFTVVDINPENLDPLERTVDIRIRVKERKAAWIEGGFGVGNILGSRIFALWGTRNMRGTGLGLRFKIEYGYDLFEGETIKLDEIQFRNNYWRYDVEYLQRYIFGLKVLMSLEAYVEKDATVENIVVRRVGGRLLSRRRLSRFSEMLVGFTNEFIDRSAFGRLADESEVRYLTNSYSIDKRDFILNPRTGNYHFLRLKLAGGILGGTDDFYTASAASQWYWPLLRSDVLAIRVRGGYGDHYGQSAEIPIEDRFFAGGSNSVRGYENNSLGPKITNEETGEFLPLGGRALLLTNVELRFVIPLLSKIRISGAAFFDGGNVWENPKDIKLSDFQIFKSDSDVDVNDYRYGVGLGIRYNTPVGPIRLDYGVPLKVEVGQSSKGMFYLSLGQTF